MFTVKLVKGSHTKLVQAEEVNICAAGPRNGIAKDPIDRTNDVREVAILGPRNEAFYITSPLESKPQGWALETQFFDAAYIENEAGATTEIVRPY